LGYSPDNLNGPNPALIANAKPGFLCGLVNTVARRHQRNFRQAPDRETEMTGDTALIVVVWVLVALVLMLSLVMISVGLNAGL
jgi:hypothetical protein